MTVQAPTEAVIVVGSTTDLGLCMDIADELRRAGLDAQGRTPWPSVIRPPLLVVMVTDDLEMRPPWPCECLVVCCDLSARTVLLALRTGIDGIAHRGSKPHEIARRSIDAMAGTMAVPRSVLLDIVAKRATADDQLSSDESRWLELMAAGLSAARVADACCISERDLYRRLQRLYRRLGVAGREGAIAHAARIGAI